MNPVIKVPGRRASGSASSPANNIIAASDWTSVHYTFIASHAFGILLLARCLLPRDAHGYIEALSAAALFQPLNPLSGVLKGPQAEIYSRLDR